jgi:hypothetical protein
LLICPVEAALTLIILKKSLYNLMKFRCKAYAQDAGYPGSACGESWTGPGAEVLHVSSLLDPQPRGTGEPCLGHPDSRCHFSLSKHVLKLSHISHWEEWYFYCDAYMDAAMVSGLRYRIRAGLLVEIGKTDVWTCKRSIRWLMGLYKQKTLGVFLYFPFTLNSIRGRSKLSVVLLIHEC